MRFFIPLFILIVLLPFCSFGQLPSTSPAGPRALGLGGTSVMLTDSWAVFNNAAGITDVEKVSGMVAYQTIFNFSNFNTVSAGFVIPSKALNAGFSVYRFGDDIFNSQMASLTLAKKTGIVRLGVKANYLQYNIEGFGRKGTFMADMGAIADLTPQLTFGAFIRNFTQSTISQDTHEKLPTFINLGLAYHPTEDLNLLIEGEKEVESEPDLKFGIEYEVVEKLVARTGFSTLTNTHSFGAGIHLNRFLFDYAIRINPKLGNTHNFGITFQLKK